MAERERREERGEEEKRREERGGEEEKSREGELLLRRELERAGCCFGWRKSV